MAFDAFGAPQFGLNDVKIAAYNSTGSYGTAVDVPSVQLLGAMARLIAGELEGDDKITDVGSSIIGTEATLRYGSVSLAVLEVVMGVSSRTDGSAYDNLAVQGGEAMPYFGLCGKINATQGSGDLHVFIPKLKLMSDIELVRAEYGAYTIPEATYQGVEDTTYGAFQIIEHATAAAVALPPTHAHSFA